MIVRSIIELAGFPKEHIEESMKQIMGKLKEEKEIKILRQEIAEIKEVKKMWATYTELELNIENFAALTHFCFYYMPSSVEILKPESFEVPANNIAGLFNDVLARLHKNEMVVRSLYLENQKLKKNQPK